jgi:hypothetical protein
MRKSDRLGKLRQRLGAQLLRLQVYEGGKSIDAVPLHGDVTWPNIAFLKNPNRAAGGAGDAADRTMDGPAIAKKKYRIVIALGDQGLQEGGPLGEGSREADDVARRVEPVVAGVEVDLRDATAALFKNPGEPAEEWTDRPLQEQDTLVRRQRIKTKTSYLHFSDFPLPGSLRILQPIAFFLRCNQMEHDDNKSNQIPLPAVKTRMCLGAKSC